jgi:hypothetical protein
MFNDRNKYLPMIVNVEAKSDYENIFNEIIGSRVLRVSDFCSDKSIYEPGKLILEIKKTTNKTVVLGLFHLKAFQDGEQGVADTLDLIGRFDIKGNANIAENTNKKLFFLTFGLEKQISDCVKKNQRLKDMMEIITISKQGQEVCEFPEIIISKHEEKEASNFSTLKEYYKKLEEVGSLRGYVFLTQNNFNNEIYNVTTQRSAYSKLCMKNPIISLIREDALDDDQWISLISSADDIYSYFKSQFDNSTIKEVIKDFYSLKKDKKSILFVWLKICNHDGYLNFVSKRVEKTDDIIKTIYDAILEIDVDNKDYPAFYNERKEFLKCLSDSNYLESYINKLNKKDKNKVWYLTDSTEEECKEIIKCFVDFEFTKDEILDFTSKNYPLLNYYIEDFYFENENKLDDYINEYKIQKLTNKISEKFREKVNKYAIERPYNSLKTRNKILDEIKKDKMYVIWIDGLGAEFSSFFDLYCSKIGLETKIHVGSANLPTITEKNKDFKTLSEKIDSIRKELDELRHDNQSPYYSKYPCYICDELVILEKIITDAKKQIEEHGHKKVVIVSDHGSSRLAVIDRADDSNGSKKIIVQKKLESSSDDKRHGGRCCPWDQTIIDKNKFITGEKEIEYCVMANYNYFSNSQSIGVELHGGATLEEVMVPIIEITAKGDIECISYSEKLKFVNGSFEPLKIEFNKKVNNVKIKIVCICDKLKKTNTKTEDDISASSFTDKTCEFPLTSYFKNKKITNMKIIFEIIVNNEIIKKECKTEIHAPLFEINDELE